MSGILLPLGIATVIALSLKAGGEALGNIVGAKNEAVSNKTETIPFFENGSGLKTSRKSRFFPVHIVRFPNTMCIAENGDMGTCYTRNQCWNADGTASGKCANNYGVCCIVQKSCGAELSQNNSYFVSPDYPNAYTGSDQRCTLTITKCNDEVCQVRLDFLEFSLAPPDFNGVCQDDVFIVSGAGSVVPRLCGENAGEHVYIDFPPGSNSMQISIDTNMDVAFDRRWRIKISQHECNCPGLAPSGCLMYYTGVRGTVQSFNYGTTPSMAEGGMVLVGTRELANLNYGVCVQMESDHCSIEWSQCSTDSFTVSGDSDALEPILVATATILVGTCCTVARQATVQQVPTRMVAVATEINRKRKNSFADKSTPIAAVNGEACTGDFVVIPNPSQGDTDLNVDRFCGNALPTTTTSSKPFVLTVVTDANELNNPPDIPPDNANRGFCLQYRQLPCPR